MTPKDYSDKKGWAGKSINQCSDNLQWQKRQQHLIKSYGQTASDVDKNVFTHGEIERKGVREGKVKSTSSKVGLGLS